MVDRQILSISRFIKCDPRIHSLKKAPRLKFEYSRSITASTATVWDALTDPAAMEPHLPGTAKVVATGSSRYRVSMKISMGFLRPTVNADAQLSNVVQRQSFSIDLSGKAMGAGVNGIAEATLEVGPATSSTRLTMIGTVQTSGLLAKIADSKIESAVTGFLDEYFASVERGG